MVTRLKKTRRRAGLGYSDMAASGLHFAPAFNSIASARFGTKHAIIVFQGAIATACCLYRREFEHKKQTDTIR